MSDRINIGKRTKHYDGSIKASIRLNDTPPELTYEWSGKKWAEVDIHIVKVDTEHGFENRVIINADDTWL